ncbi:Clavaminate synthase-like protein [Gonapodya prolifera JEL478]|uniref:Clavaminate synthase-like protein n=1 Tax=Gonapodya prolifera (strain JEL478) TaxID=1344416 RepID=A0A139AU02_GONPJ|nr:Clavaminate synthase-like protein [Gonapodya prolifera JEL478]|eukprot:KXS20226.1 Clavaminate synthase-like protein [Gonapodya prolifera JEL478]
MSRVRQGVRYGERGLAKDVEEALSDLTNEARELVGLGDGDEDGHRDDQLMSPASRLFASTPISPTSPSSPRSPGGTRLAAIERQRAREAKCPVQILQRPPTALEFLRIVNEGRPVLIKNAVNHWPAFKLWKHRKFIEEALGHSAPITVSVTPDGLADAIVDDFFCLPHEENLSISEALDLFAFPSYGRSPNTPAPTPVSNIVIDDPDVHFHNSLNNPNPSYSASAAAQRRSSRSRSRSRASVRLPRNSGSPSPRSLSRPRGSIDPTARWTWHGSVQPSAVPDGSSNGNVTFSSNSGPYSPSPISPVTDSPVTPPMSHRNTALAVQTSPTSLQPGAGGAKRVLSKRNAYYIQSQDNNLHGEFAGLLERGDVPREIGWATEAFGRSPDAANFWLGDEKSVTSLHKDHYENLFVVIQGRKTFTIIPPTDAWLLYERDYPAAIHTPTHPSLGTWSLTELEGSEARTVPWPSVDPTDPDARKAWKLWGKHGRSWKVEVQEGELLYLPATWYHHVAQTPPVHPTSTHPQTDLRACIAVNYWYDMAYEFRYAYFGLVRQLAGLVDGRRAIENGMETEDDEESRRGGRSVSRTRRGRMQELDPAAGREAVSKYFQDPDQRRASASTMGGSRSVSRGRMLQGTRSPSPPRLNTVAFQPPPLPVAGRASQTSPNYPLLVDVGTSPTAPRSGSSPRPSSSRNYSSDQAVLRAGSEGNVAPMTPSVVEGVPMYRYITSGDAPWEEASNAEGSMNSRAGATWGGESTRD